MMKKTQQWVRIALLVGACSLRCGASAPAIGYDATLPEVPEGVVYEPLPDEAFIAAGEALLTCLNDEGCEPTGGMLILGPRLTQELRPDERLLGIRANTEFLVPTMVNDEPIMLHLSGEFAQTREEVLVAWAVVRDRFRLDDQATFRRPNYDELATYWTYIPYDIEDPVFIVETTDGDRLIIDTLPNGNVIWVDDLRETGLDYGRGLDPESYTASPPVTSAACADVMPRIESCFIASCENDAQPDAFNQFPQNCEYLPQLFAMLRDLSCGDTGQAVIHQLAAIPTCEALVTTFVSMVNEAAAQQESGTVE